MFLVTMFGSLVEEEEIEAIKKSFESKNTRKNTNWSISTFQEWRKYRMEITGTYIPDLEGITNETEMNELMSRFVIEARRRRKLVSTHVTVPVVRGSTKTSMREWKSVELS